MAIHCLWYCVSSSEGRFEDKEAEFVRSLTEEMQMTHVPVIIVLTKSSSDSEAAKLKSHIENLNLGVIQVVTVLATDYPVDANYTKKAYGLDTVLEVMTNALPKEVQKTLQYVQKVSLDIKVKSAQKVVAAGLTASLAEAAVPLPFESALALVPTQISMLAGITVVFGIDVSKSMIISFISAVIGTSAATIGGKILVSNVLKLVPGIGSIAGSAINAATAGMITTVLGEAYIKIMTLISKGEMSVEEISTTAGRKRIQEIIGDTDFKSSVTTMMESE